METLVFTSLHAFPVTFHAFILGTAFKFLQRDDPLSLVSLGVVGIATCAAQGTLNVSSWWRCGGKLGLGSDPSYATGPRRIRP